jgi:hypothetical protein
MKKLRAKLWLREGDGSIVASRESELLARNYKYVVMGLVNCTVGQIKEGGMYLGEEEVYSVLVGKHDGKRTFEK